MHSNSDAAFSRRRRTGNLCRHRSGNMQTPTSFFWSSNNDATLNRRHRVENLCRQRSDNMQTPTSFFRSTTDGTSLTKSRATYALNRLRRYEIIKRRRTRPTTSTSSVVSFFPQLLDLGKPEYTCEFCGAIFWYNERLKKFHGRVPRYGRCCRRGIVSLPLLRETPFELQHLFDVHSDSRGSLFRKNIRLYNSMFAFTSIGAKIDSTVNVGRGPYTFRIQGQNYHCMGSLLPVNGVSPRFAQLYVYDTQNEVSNRLNALNVHESPGVDPFIVKQMMDMLDRCNPIVQQFRMARDRVSFNPSLSFTISIINKAITDTSIYNVPHSSELAALIVGDFGRSENANRDIIVQYQTGHLERISDLHPSFMALQYPLLFPYGEDGFHLSLKYAESQIHARRRKSITMRDFYAFRLQFRHKEGHTLLRGGRLLQQYIVDSYACVEESRLHYIRRHQSELRSELYMGIKDAVTKGDVDGCAVGKRIILPSSFTGSPRYMIQNYQDAIAICRWFGDPDLFVTFTCNSQWNEITEAVSMLPNQKAEDRPDIVSRVFNMKVFELISDIEKRSYFGKCAAVLYTVEFQKRGLPHVHILVWLENMARIPSIQQLDSMISAELPNQTDNALAFELVLKFMVHGPCGPDNPISPCMKNGKCSKHFPKNFSETTSLNDDGFVLYKQRRFGPTALKNDIEIDNRYIVPYNLGLLMRYRAHINVEWCSKSRMIKYLFKYINKGPDRVRAVVTENVAAHGVIEVDEVKNYLDCRYLSSHEAIWRLFEFDIHYRNPSVEHLPVHLPMQHNIVFKRADFMPSVVSRPGITKTMFTEWMQANSVYADARSLTYAEFPTNFVWNSRDKEWSRRGAKKRIGRIIYIHPNAGELYYLRMLLSIVHGPQNYEEIRTVNGVLHSSFQEACRAYGLLGDDKEWFDALNDANSWATSLELRKLFTTILLYCEVGDPNKLFNNFWPLFADDILYKIRRQLSLPNVVIPEDSLRNYVLLQLEFEFNSLQSSLKEHGLPMPQQSESADLKNRLIIEEISYNRDILMQEHRSLHSSLNSEQLNIYDVVTTTVLSGKSGFYFVYGYGGTGKTFLWQTIISRIRTEGHIVLAVASSGIASLLLPGGRTAHSRFKIPITVDELTTCAIKKGSQLAELIKKTKLIVWDEAPMTHRYCFEALDKSLQDIMCDTVDCSSEIFGGITVLLGGDFRQILPVVSGGNRSDIVDACICRSHLWKFCTLFTLRINMRLLRAASPLHEIEMTEFSDWLLSVGCGSNSICIKDSNVEDDFGWISIPDDLLIPNNDFSIDNIVHEVYDELVQMYNTPAYLKERAIITPWNDVVSEINEHILSFIPGDEISLLSSDSIASSGKQAADYDILYPVEFLNSIKINGIPDHCLKLKLGVPVMLLRNLNQNEGLCNGTRLIVTSISQRIVEATIISGSHIGATTQIPRIITYGNTLRWPFTLKRRQFPLRVCYAMTINKSQGQTLTKVGVYLSKPVFAHGQLYVALSRVTSRSGLRILLKNDKDIPLNCTKNVVYTEIFDDLPHAEIQ